MRAIAGNNTGVTSPGVTAVIRGPYMTGFSRASTKKPSGRPKGSLGPTARAIRAAVTGLTDRFDRMTVRQVFYALVSAGVVPKTENGGYRPVQHEILRMRRDGLLKWSFIADGTRWQRKPNTWGSVGGYIEAVSRSYRRDLWQSQDVRIEVWLEKDALADLIMDVTYKWDVSLMVSRGQSSATFLHSAKMAALNAEVPTYIYLLYDFDAGGNRAARTIERELSTDDGDPVTGAEPKVYVERLAVTHDQIVMWGLPTRPAKKTNPEASKNPDYAVELDAIDPERLTRLVEDAILRHVDAREWEVEKAIEEEEREGLLALAQQWRNGNES